MYFITCYLLHVIVIVMLCYYVIISYYIFITSFITCANFVFGCSHDRSPIALAQ